MGPGISARITVSAHLLHGSSLAVFGHVAFVVSRYSPDSLVSLSGQEVAFKLYCVPIT